jgi:hypothetical protein
MGEERIKIYPGSKVLVVSKLGGEPDEVEKTLNMIAKVNQLKTEYELMKKGDLENEYKRIYSDFELSMKLQSELSAILGVLVDKYSISDEDIKSLRG